MEQAVVVCGLRHRYGSTVALRGIDLELPAGSLTGLLGPDGVGKSTLLAIIAGAKRIQEGKVCVLGGDMADARHRRLMCPRIAYMPQGLGRNLYPDLTITENIALFASLFGQSAEECDRHTEHLLAATGLTPFADRLARNLSGGMRQKLGLCCALVHDPDLLILDEPTTGIDPLSRRQFWGMIDSLREKRPGMSVIVATAYMEEAERFDGLLVMHDGAVLATGSASHIRKMTGCRNLEEGFIALLPAAVRATRTRPNIPSRRSSDGEIAIRAVDLTRRFGDFTAVENVSFTIRRGEIFGFVGSNGCGKTTTMKMLTGLLQATSGSAIVLGRPVDATDTAMRRRVGYMSQSFSLYTELTVEQNLLLHARLYNIPAQQARRRLDVLATSFSLSPHLGSKAADLPLGIRQRLSLAVAVVHEPDLLILDEPTSGVDPLARDAFWALLGDLSRHQGVTIFVSTHFMNEAARCDRISLMHAGRVLATGSAEELVQAWGGGTLEDAFIASLHSASPPDPVRVPTLSIKRTRSRSLRPRAFSLSRLLAYARREWLELMRDRIRLSFALGGLALLFLVFGLGINTDVDNLSFAAFDRDQTMESRTYLQAFRGSAYFTEDRAITSSQDLEKRLSSGSLKVALEIPAGFGRDLRRGRPTEVSAWIDGAVPFRAETARGYLEGLHAAFLREVARSQGREPDSMIAAKLETRFRYNQSYESVNALVPGDIAMLLALFPAILMALATVREKELGSITNLYVTPVTRLEFIVGKQLPYIGLAMVDFAFLVLMATQFFDVPVKGNLAALTLGTIIYVFATTCYGLLISTFAKTQIAALFGTAILTVVPATQFCGMLAPISSLTGMGAIMGRLFPMSYYLPISVGVFTKGLGLTELIGQMIYLSLFFPTLLMISILLLRKQER